MNDSVPGQVPSAPGSHSNMLRNRIPEADATLPRGCVPEQPTAGSHTPNENACFNRSSAYSTRNASERISIHHVRKRLVEVCSVSHAHPPTHARVFRKAEILAVQQLQCSNSNSDTCSCLQRYANLAIESERGACSVVQRLEAFAAAAQR